MNRPFNFGAGPATLPEEVLRQVAEEMLDWNGTGMSVMEMSHRGEAFMSIHEQTLSDLRTLLQVPKAVQILIMQGGGTGQNAIAPLNMYAGGVVDFVLTGTWSRYSRDEARKYVARARTAASADSTNYTTIPPAATWEISEAAAYVQICSNETIQGVQFPQLPDLRKLGSAAPLVVDMSSDIASRPIDWNRVGVVFAGAQKNLGLAGLTLVFVREDLMGHALSVCPSAFNYELVASSNSMYNTPPTWGIYVLGLMIRWISQQREGEYTGLEAMEIRRARQARHLYVAIDRSGFYRNEVDPAVRSQMNIPFWLADASLNAVFLSRAAERGLLQLNGHSSVGGMRASMYNAMTDGGVNALAMFLQDFERYAG